MTRPKLIIILLLLVTLVLTGFIIDFRLKASILQIARTRAQVLYTERINHIVNEKVVAQMEYTDLVHIHKDEQGRIVLLQPDTAAMNRVIAGTVEEIARAMTDAKFNVIQVPLGQLTGSEILAGYGPRLQVRILPAGQVHADILNKFDQAGVNQTRHFIYCKIRSDIKVAVLYMEEPVQVVTVIPLAESIIVGEVPKTYVSLDKEKNTLYPIIKGD